MLELWYGFLSQAVFYANKSDVIFIFIYSYYLFIALYDTIHAYTAQVSSPEHNSTPLACWKSVNERQYWF